MEETSTSKENVEKGSCGSITDDQESENKKPSVRPYMRSKMPRLRWTPDLHLRFSNAVERLGGQERATPKLVLQMMNIKGLSIAHVKSHLQMYRSKKTDNPSQGGDCRIYNLSQLPMLQGYNHWHSTSPTFGFSGQGGISWNIGSQPLKHGSFVQRSSSEIPRSERYGTVYESYGSNLTNMIARQSISIWPTNELKYATKASDHSDNSLQSSQNTSVPQEFCSLVQERKEMKRKRKASDWDLNLDLSLKLTQMNNNSVHCKSEDSESNSNLSLCLCYPSISSKLGRMEYGSKQKHDAKRASTLDLTL